MIDKEEFVDVEIPEVKDAKEGIDFIYDTYKDEKVKKNINPIKLRIEYCDKTNNYEQDFDQLKRFI